MKKVKKNYRIREDIARELDGLLVMINLDLPEGEGEIKETFLVESALVMYMAKVKRGMCANASLRAKCADLDRYCGELEKR